MYKLLHFQGPKTVPTVALCFYVHSVLFSRIYSCLCAHSTRVQNWRSG